MSLRSVFGTLGFVVEIFRLRFPTSLKLCRTSSAQDDRGCTLLPRVFRLRSRKVPSRGLVSLALCFAYLQIFAFHGMSKNIPDPTESIYQTTSRIVLLQADAEHVWGAYYFAVQNTLTEAQVFQSHIKLPLEVVDFQVGESLTNEDVSLLPDGRLEIKKQYRPGLSLQSLQFKAPINRMGDTVLTFMPDSPRIHFYFATVQESLDFKADGFEKGIPPMLQGSAYKGIHSDQFGVGDSIKLKISGIPGSRKAFVILATIFAFLLFGIAGLFCGVYFRRRFLDR